MSEIGGVEEVLGSFVTVLALVESITSETVGNSTRMAKGVSVVEEISIHLVAFSTCKEIGTIQALTDRTRFTVKSGEVDELVQRGIAVLTGRYA